MQIGMVGPDLRLSRSTNAKQDKIEKKPQQGRGEVSEELPSTAK
jgi:hypothetical protein